jgi:GxxExxY protein
VTENEIAKIVLNEAFALHTELGPGLLESVYEVLLAHRLREAGLHVERQVPIPIRYHGVTFDEGFRADLFVEDLVIVELKSVEALLRVHGKQLLTQLRLSERRLGLLINFGAEHLKDSIKRVVNGLADDSQPSL